MCVYRVCVCVCGAGFSQLWELMPSVKVRLINGLALAVSCQLIHFITQSLSLRLSVTDPTIRQPGFHLPPLAWSLMNRFWTGQGPCRANLHKWGLVQSPSCDCGQRQTMNHTVDTCPFTQFEGGLNLLHEVDDDAVIWLEPTATAALVK